MLDRFVQRLENRERMILDRRVEIVKEHIQSTAAYFMFRKDMLEHEIVYHQRGIRFPLLMLPITTLVVVLEITLLIVFYEEYADLLMYSFIIGIWIWIAYININLIRLHLSSGRENKDGFFSHETIGIRHGRLPRF